jgi:hypothetical protein
MKNDEWFRVQIIVRLTYRKPFLAMHLPVVLGEIKIKLGMHGRVFSLPTCLKKCLSTIQIPLWFHLSTNIVIEEL